jgi:hypothetical protein
MSGYSSVALANLALRRVGSKRTISALTDDSQEAQVCNDLYAHSRDTVLDTCPWPFAMRYADLVLVEESPSTDWAYSYRYPTECLKIRRILSSLNAHPVRWNNDWRTWTINPQIPFEIGSDTQGILIYTNQQDAQVQYTCRFTDASFFTPLFADCVAWRLAADIAMPLSISDGIRQTCETFYNYALSEAVSAARNEEQLDTQQDSEFTRSRL